MASVFLSYDHDDARRAAPLAEALETHGHSVWWDRHIHGGAEYNSAIETAVEESGAVVVLWSEKSIRSAWVRDEAAEGRDAGKLVPVLIDRVKPPMGFRQYQTIDLAAWNGGKRVPRLPEILDAIDKVSGANPAAATPPAASTPPPRTRTTPVTAGPWISRRRAIAGGTAAIAALAGGGLWWSRHSPSDPRFDALIDLAEDAVRNFNYSDKSLKAAEQAVAIRPDSAKAWGLLGLLKSYGLQDPDQRDTETLVQDAQHAAQRALSIDPQQPDALLAMFELEGSTLDWFARDQRLRQIVAIDAKNLGAMAELVLLTQATGMSRESWQWNERVLELAPLSIDALGKRALKLWILGRTGEADKVIDQARALHPSDFWPWFVRIHIYAFTGRAAAALALMDSEPAMAAKTPMTPLWRAALPAVAQPSPTANAKARAACIQSAEIAPPSANEAVQLLCAIGDIDTAFEVANGLLLSRGPIVPRQRPGSANAAESAEWRVGTQWMFTPSTAAMRTDPRFLPLCDGIGLIDYWRKRGMKPDYQRA